MADQSLDNHQAGVYKGFMCKHLTVQKRDERYKGLATTFSFLQTGPPRLKKTSEQSIKPKDEEI